MKTKNESPAKRGGIVCFVGSPLRIMIRRLAENNPIYWAKARNLTSHFLPQAKAYGN